jgi:hypothetical protein
MKVSLHLFSVVGILFLLFLPTISYSQQSQIIREPAFGVEFTAPDGWQYQKTEGGYLMGHNSIAGMIIVTINPYKSLAEMRQGAYEGIQEEGGTSLNINGDLKSFGKNGLAGNYQGIMNWEQVNAYIIGLISPFGGKGITCMIISTPDMFSEVHKNTLERLANSFKFFKPEIPDAVKEWDVTFKSPGGCRLKYMHVSSSSGYGSGYAGGSTERTFDLCPNGSFSFRYNSDYSISADAGAAANSSNDAGAGQWKLSFDGTNVILEFIFNDGRDWEYVLSYIDQKTYLDDTRYFLLLNDEGPQCY